MYTVAVAGAVLLLEHGFAAIFGEQAVPTVLAQQQDPFLSRRIDQIENRFYQIESRIDRVESATRPTLSSPPLTSNVNDQEIRFLRQQIDVLRTRLGEAECGLLHVDERTLTPAARAARTKSTSGSEPCRSNPGTPIALSVRP